MARRTARSERSEKSVATRILFTCLPFRVLSCTVKCHSGRLHLLNNATLRTDLLDYHKNHFNGDEVASAIGIGCTRLIGKLNH
jgi:hypothetical protein